MNRRDLTIKKVAVFKLIDDVQRVEYEALMNNVNITITKTVIGSDKGGNPIVTVWYEEEFMN